MKSWEASEEEIKAATLGGVVPGSSIGGVEDAGRTDAFDVGLYIAFPIMIISCLAVSCSFHFSSLCGAYSLQLCETVVSVNICIYIAH